MGHVNHVKSINSRAGCNIETDVLDIHFRILISALRALVILNAANTADPPSVNGRMRALLLREPLLVVLGILFPALFAILEFASAGESSAGVPGQTWLCHHFFPT
jgi:hypothetical protein